MSENTRKCCDSVIGSTHEFGCVEQESGERYVVEIRASDLLADVVDTLTGRRVAVDIHPVLAVKRAATLNRRHEAGMTDPTVGPLKPKLASERERKLRALLAGVRGAEDEALSQMTGALVELNRAIALRERLEHMLERPVRPLSATESTCPRHGAVL